MKIAFYFRNVSGGIKAHVDSLSKEFEKRGNGVKKIDQFSLGSYMLGDFYGLDFSMCRIREEVKGCDVLHVHHAATFSEFLISLSEICDEIPVVNTFHIPIGSSFECALTKMVIVALARLYTNRSKKFISVSAQVAKILRRHSENETVVIPNGVDIDRFHPKEKDGSKERKTEKKICIGYLGRLSREKNIINMIKAMKMLDKDSISFKIAGSGPLYNRIKSMEDGRIRVLGYVEDASSFYHSIDVFLLPSKLEAQPIVLLEAMASGLPIIATDVGDNEYFIENNGIFCGTSAKEIREAMEEILKEDLKKMGSLSRIKVEREYTWERIAEKTLQVYKTI